MQRFHLDMYGIGTTHTKDFVVDYINHKNNSWQTYVIMCFQTPALLLTVNGMERVCPGDVILHAPPDHVYHHSTEDMEDGFVNDWLYVVSECAEQFIPSLDLPYNTLIHTHDPMFLRGFLQSMEVENARRQPLFEQYVSNQLEAMLLRIARFRKMQPHEYSLYSEMLYDFRQKLLNTYSEKWTVRRMANELNLSDSYFSIQYRKLFDLSPIDDLIEIRLQAARSMLRNTVMSVHQISVECGFQSEYYFSKLFKKRMGISPTTYRNQHLSFYFDRPEGVLPPPRKMNFRGRDGRKSPLHRAMQRVLYAVFLNFRPSMAAAAQAPPAAQSAPIGSAFSSMETAGAIAAPLVSRKRSSRVISSRPT